MLPKRILDVEISRLSLAFSIVIALVSQVQGLAQPEKQAQDSLEITKAKAKDARLEIMKRMVSHYELFPGADDQKLERRAEPIMRWTNPVRGAKDGCVFLWTRSGIPQAIVCFYPSPRTDGSTWDHEFQSLSRQELVAWRDQVPVWTPDKPGVDFKAVPNAPTPAETAVLRLSQIRKLSGRFSASNIVNGEKSALRLLSTPLYRYEKPPDDVLDGAVFAFVQGTDPELLLLLEARREQGETVWKYALARMTGFPLEASYDDRPIWSIERWDWDASPKQPYLTFARQPPE